MLSSPLNQRPNRPQQLQNDLRIESPHGDAATPVKTIIGGDAAEEDFDVLILSCKAFGLVDALPANLDRCSLVGI
jgi:ketopantoate reductase